MICVSIGNISFEELTPHLPHIEMVELRLDLLSFTDEQYRLVIEQCKSSIATFRPQNHSDKERIRALKKMMQFGVQFIDIEIDSSEMYKSEILQLAHQYHCQVIISYHHFTETPQLSILESVIHKAQIYQPDLVKIVTTPHSESNVERVLSLYQNHKNIIAFCMGNLGQNSRLRALKLGAKFTYASLSNSQTTASGQMDYHSMKATFKQDFLLNKCIKLPK